ncbi:MAG: hypothetical protein LHV68_09150 [Elusimicrobia bacterium]|nr:hypothetical protein [Candidatus Liberimonas magnetica]
MDIKKIFTDIVDVFDDEKDDPDEPKYDPVHVGAMIILVIFAIAVLFWLLWALLVFGGGLQAKIIPFLKILFTSNTAGDFGYVGYPYEMGVFEGWPTNVVAFIFAVLLLAAVWHVFNNTGNISGKKEENKNEN